MDTASYERHPSQPEGSVLGDTYRLVRRIGFGGMGEVYEATHVRLPGRFAVKILLPDLLGNREAFARFCREAEIMSELRHPNIVQIFDFNATTEGRPYFVMEYLEGRDLEARLAEVGALPLPTVVRIVTTVASALATAHGHGVVHRDLKPANIFLGTVDGQADELIKVLDFGISQVRSTERRLSQPNHVLGTPPYMAPEQVRGAVESIDGRADQFALGAIAYRALTGHDAFRGQDTPALLYQIVHEHPAPLVDNVPSDWDAGPLQAVLDRALAKYPEQRWGGMMELARAFEDAAERTLSDGPPIARLPRSTTPAPEPVAAIPSAALDEVLDEPPPVRLVALPARAPAGEQAATRTAGPATPKPATVLPMPVRPAKAKTPEKPKMQAKSPANSPTKPPAKTASPRAAAPAAVARDFSPPGPAVPWDLPSDVDRIPVTRARAATLGIVALALMAILIATGWYRQTSMAIPFASQNLRAWISHPAPLDQPRADQTAPPARELQPAKSGGEPVPADETQAGGPKAAAAHPASEHPATGAPPPRPRASARTGHRHRAPAPVATPLPPGTIQIAPATPPEPSPLPAPTGSPGPGLSGESGGFEIAPPKEQAPARDLAPPPPDSDSDLPPPRSNSAEPLTPPNPPPP